MEFVLPGPIRRNFNPNNVIFEDYFERTSVGPLWDGSEVASISISNGKLVVVPAFNTTWLRKGAIFTPNLNLLGDFEVEGKFSYTSPSNSNMSWLGIGLFDSVDTATGCIIGMNDSWAGSSGCLTIWDINPPNGMVSVYGTAAGSRPLSGSPTYKIVRVGSTVSFYEDGVLRYSYTKTDTFKTLKLISMAYTSSYPVITAYWDYIKVTNS